MLCRHCDEEMEPFSPGVWECQNDECIYYQEENVRWAYEETEEDRERERADLRLDEQKDGRGSE